MKNIFALLLAVSFGFVSLAQESQAKITFKTETIDYGTIEKSSNGVRVFEFTNTGNAPLVITDVKSSCGCTIPKKPEKPIMPGENGVIEVKYDTKRVAPFRKTITVTSNAERSTVALKIKGTVVDSEAGDGIMDKKKTSVIKNN
jgi:hypothetical protein